MDIIYRKSSFGHAVASIYSGGGAWGWASSLMLAAHKHPQIPIPVCRPCVSGSPQTRTDSVQTRLISLIHNSQFRCTEQNRTEPPPKSQSSSHCCRSKSTCFLRCVVESGSAVIGSKTKIQSFLQEDRTCSPAFLISFSNNYTHPSYSSSFSVSLSLSCTSNLSSPSFHPIFHAITSLVMYESLMRI